jgi:regulator of nonsense transcripts 2
VPFSTDDNGDSSGAKLVTERRQATDDDIFGGIESTPGASADVNAPVQAPPQALYELVMLPEKRQPFVTLLDKFFDKLTTFVMKEHQQLVQVEKHNRDLLMTKGELSTNAQEEYEKTRNAFFKLHQNFIQLAELMDKDVPELPEEEKTSRVPDATPLSRESAGLAALEAANLEDKDTGVWDDEDQKNLYENIPDLKVC